jgi:hypothetical protein
MNTLAESDLPFYNWMFRVGFDLRNLHTLFDYVYNASRTVDANSGKFLAGWVKRSRMNNNHFHGGHTADLEVLEDSAVAKKVAEYFWDRHIRNGLKKEAAHLLFAHVLINLSKFVNVLKNEPKGKYSNESNSSHFSHPFLVTLNACFTEMKIKDETINRWIMRLTQQYKRSNSLGLHSSQQNTQLTPEQRSIQDQLDSIQEIQSHLMTDGNMRHLEHVEMRKVMHRMAVAQEQMAAELKQSNELLRSGGMLPPSATGTTAAASQISGMMNQTPPTQTDQSRMWDHFIQNFTDIKVSWKDKYVSYYAKKVDEFYDQKKGKKKSDINNKNSIGFLMNELEAMIGEKPTASPEGNIQGWKRTLEQMGLKAEKALFQRLELDENQKKGHAFSTVIKKLRAAVTAASPPSSAQSPAQARSPLAEAAGPGNASEMEN